VFAPLQAISAPWTRTVGDTSPEAAVRPRPSSVERAAITLQPLSLLVYTLAAFKFAVTFVFAGGYGFHRDELYYLASAAHPQLGYVDYPPITPMVARLDTMIFGTHTATLRLVPVLAGAAIVVLAGLIARELGGGRAAQVLAAFCVLVSGVYLFEDWLFMTVALDQLMWAVTIYLMVRLLRTHDTRLWVPLGVAIGLGLETKYTIVALILAIGVGILATRERRQLASVWPWLGAALALAILAPNLVWQVQHEWPSLTYLGTHHGRIAQETSRTTFIVEQLELVNAFLLPIVVAGMWWMFRRAGFRPLIWIPIVIEAVFLVAGGKPYYAEPMFVLLYAAGAVAVAPYLFRGRSRLRWSLATAPAVLLALALLPLAMPVLPARQMASMGCTLPARITRR